MAVTAELYHPITWEVLAGARYFRWDESFYVLGQGGVLDSSFWNTRSINNMGGGQIGLRFAHRRNRLMFTTEGRFAAWRTGKTICNRVDRLEYRSRRARDGPRKLAELAAHRLEHRRSKDRVFALGRIAVQPAIPGLQQSVGQPRLDRHDRGRRRPAERHDQLPIAEHGHLVHGNNRQTVFMQGLTLGLIFNR